MGVRVLIADDDKTARTLICKALAAIGVENPVEAAAGDEALSLLQGDEFDLAILDGDMPGMTGLEIIRAIRGAGSELPILMVTASADKGRVIEAVQAGANDYLAKPFDQRTLEKKIERLCPADDTEAESAVYRVKSVMNKNVIMLPDTATVGDAQDILLEHRISGLPVVDAQEQLVGVITEYQLLQTIYRPEIKQQAVTDIMTREVVSVAEDTILSEVAKVMESKRIRRIPVVQEGRVVGIISRRDLLRYVNENEERIRTFLGRIKSAMGA